ncbi:MAG TPA: 50S ribosomal protein L21 [Methylomirabilota bacterium]|nr:50S ribosomal protein L21 [Methylomirabilota bacterium]
MYAVIETGGKQYRVEVGTELEVELLDAEPGKTVKLERVLLVADGDESSIGQPLVSGAAVSAEVLRQDRGPKLISFKYRPKARTRVKKGHRQELTILRISDITLNGKSAAKTAEKAESDAKTERQRVEEAAAAQAAKDAELAAKLAASAPKASSGPAKKSTPKSTESDAKTDTKTAAKTDTKAAAKKPTSKAKAADADKAKAAPKKSAPKRATKKDE